LALTRRIRITAPSALQAERPLAQQSCRGLRKARAEVAAHADCTASQMMAMVGWTDPKMPGRYIAKANRVEA
jgi:hypothetical protein